jgi:hypothetical protein
MLINIIIYLLLKLDYLKIIQKSVNNKNILPLINLKNNYLLPSKIPKSLHLKKKLELNIISSSHIANKIFIQ